MPSIPFSTGAISLISVSQISDSVLRLRFNFQPLAVNPAGTTDALNLRNYSLSGPANFVVGAVVVTTDSTAIDLGFQSAFVAGAYVITVSNVADSTQSSQITNSSLSFSVNASSSVPPPLSGGAVSDEAFDLLRKYMTPAIQGDNTTALLKALAVGDAYAQKNAQSAFDQLFVSTAKDIYLDRRCSDLGILRPENISLSDDDFRNLTIKITNNKLTLNAMLQALESYYSTEVTMANATASVAEPYSLQDGDTLLVKINNETIRTISFKNADFYQIMKATAIEVAAVISKQLRLSGSAGWAAPYKDPNTGLNYVRIYCGSLGITGYVAIAGGRAQNALLLPALLNTAQNATTQWQVSLPVLTPSWNGIASGRVRFTWIGGTDPSLKLVNVGDYANVFGPNFSISNRGSFTVVAVTPTYFEIVNQGAVQSSVTQASASDVLFFASTKTTIQNGRMATAIQTDSLSFEVVLPTTSEIVSGTPTTAAYLHVNNTDNGVDGPYIIDENNGLPITDTTGTLNQQLIQGQTYKSIAITGVAGTFPDSGYLVFNFGQATQVAPVKYIGKISSNQLLLDISYVFPVTLPAGTDITLLANKAGLELEAPESIGLFYLTGTADARLEAQSTIESIAGAGVSITETVVYPGDRGLGGEGMPSTGTGKLSDKTYVWGAD